MKHTLTTCTKILLLASACLAASCTPYTEEEMLVSGSLSDAIRDVTNLYNLRNGNTNAVISNLEMDLDTQMVTLAVVLKDDPSLLDDSTKRVIRSILEYRDSNPRQYDSDKLFMLLDNASRTEHMTVMSNSVEYLDSIVVE